MIHSHIVCSLQVICRNTNWILFPSPNPEEINFLSQKQESSQKESNCIKMYLTRKWNEVKRKRKVIIFYLIFPISHLNLYKIYILPIFNILPLPSFAVCSKILDKSSFHFLCTLWRIAFDFWVFWMIGNICFISFLFWFPYFCNSCLNRNFIYQPSNKK